jgi:hypothetical protein
MPLPPRSSYASDGRARSEAIMANANHKKLGEGIHHKGAGTGAMTEVPGNKIGDNEVLSNRDKSRRPDSQGLDGREIQNEQLQDQVHNQQSGER